MGNTLPLCGPSLLYCRPCLTRAARASPARSWHCLSRFTAGAALRCLCEFSDHLKKHRAGWCLCLFLCASLRSLRDLQTAKLRGGWRREEGEKGGARMPEVGIGSSSPAWTPEPQCGVPVHILKHHDCLLLARFCLFLSSSPLLPHPLPPPLTSVSSSTSISISLSFSWLLHHLTGVFSRQCSSKQMSQAGLTLLYRHPASPLLSSALSPQT